MSENTEQTSPFDPEVSPAVMRSSPLDGPMRPPGPDDFRLDVPNVGAFMFGRRRMQDHLRINAVYSELTEGVDAPSPFLDTVCTWLSMLHVLMVRRPAGFKRLRDMDPLDDATYITLKTVCEALRVTEESFRKEPAAQVQGGGAAGGGND